MRGLRQQRTWASWTGACLILASVLTVIVLGNSGGAIYTSIDDSTVTNLNAYEDREDVYLNGGPQGMHDAGLTPDGYYYYQVTDPSGVVLLSTDDITCRVLVVSGGHVIGAPDTGDDAGGYGDPSCYHPNGLLNPANGSIAVKLMPYLLTPNGGGEYKVWLTPVASYVDGVQVLSCGKQGSPKFGFCDGHSKTDTFKVKIASLAYVTVCKFNDANANGAQDAGEPMIAHWPITATGVLGGTVLTQTEDTGCVTLAADPGVVTLTEGTFGQDWSQTAPADGTYDRFTVSGGVTSVAVVAGDDLTAPSFGNTNPYCGSACDPTDLVVTKTAFPSLTRTWDWDVAKAVDRTQVTQSGTSAMFNYTVTVTHDAGTDSDWLVAGTIRVANPGPVAIGPFDVLDAVDNGGSCTVSAGTGVTVPAGSHADFEYSCTYTSAPATGTNTATTTWSAASGTASVDFATATVVKVDDLVTVTDSLGGTLGTLAATAASPTDFTYAYTVTGTAGTCTTTPNTATVTTNTTGTSDTAGQSVTLCVGADLTVSKTATPTFNRAYTWSIAKAVDQTRIESPNTTVTFHYTVTATQVGVSDSAWQVAGVITVSNPNDFQAVTADVTDAVDNGGACTVVGGTSVTVPASDSVALDYVCLYASAPTAATFTNTATATWDAAAVFTPNGAATGTAAGGFTTPSGVVNRVIEVTDTFDSVTTTLGTLTAADDVPYVSATYTYAHAVSNAATGACQTYPNTATIVETGQTASQVVTACNTGTGALTMGFWQNKNGQRIIADANQAVLRTFLMSYAPFQDLGSKEIASWVMTVIKTANAGNATMNAMLKAQMLATALDVFFGGGPGGNPIGAPTTIGSVRISLGAAAPAFGGATSMTVLELIAWAASQSNAGGTVWYGNVKAMQALAKDVFDDINNQRAPIA